MMFGAIVFFTAIGTSEMSVDAASAGRVCPNTRLPIMVVATALRQNCDRVFIVLSLRFSTGTASKRPNPAPLQGQDRLPHADGLARTVHANGHAVIDLRGRGE